MIVISLAGLDPEACEILHEAPAETSVSLCFAISPPLSQHHDRPPGF